MIKEAICTGETIEEAFAAACKEIGCDASKAVQEVIDEPSKKKFGLFGENKPAKVKATYVPTPAEVAKEYLENILKNMGLEDSTVEIQEEESGANLVLNGGDIGFIIGHRGETLDSLQFLSQLVASNQRKVINSLDDTKTEYYRITLDVGSFREKRKETLENLGKKMAARALRIGRNQSLEPMNPYERRIIHTAVQEVEGAKSWSEGEDLARHVVIGPVDGEKPQPRYNNRSRYNNGGDRRSQRSGGRGGDRRGSSRPKYDRDRYSDKITSKISETAPVPYSPAPLDTNTERKKVVDAPLYGRIELTK